MNWLPTTILSSLLLVASIFMLAPATAQSQTNDHTGFYCEGCRNINQYPIDARNLALNQVWGARSWMNSRQASDFNIVDRFGNRLNMQITIMVNGVRLEVPFTNINPVVYPTGVEIRIIVRDGYYQTVIDTTIDPNVSNINWPLPVGDAASNGGGGGGTGSPGGSGNEGGSGGDSPSGGGGGARRGGFVGLGGSGNFCGPGTEYLCVQY